MLGFNSLSAGALSSTGGGRFIHIKYADRIFIKSSEKPEDEDGVLLLEGVSVQDVVQIFKDWAWVFTDDDAQWNKQQASASVDWVIDRLSEQKDWHTIESIIETNWVQNKSSQPVRWSEQKSADKAKWNEIATKAQPRWSDQSMSRPTSFKPIEVKSGSVWRDIETPKESHWSGEKTGDSTEWSTVIASKEKRKK